ncbi:MAG: hypothetical protein JSS31_06665 [Proteobacteria bacterium]|nr:hypothetical protein [Pseudomonadota bacterium]MBS0493633.1 hypothetical protein [Pseudomonadota bacterium]
MPQVAWRTGLLEYVDKAQGHLNAAERSLSSDNWARGAWSGQQAQARIAQVLLAFTAHRGDHAPPPWPALERSLPEEVVQALRTRCATAAATADWHLLWSECLAAEQALHDEPSRPLETVPQAQLEAGLQRIRRYKSALQALQRAAQTALIDEFVVLRRGDWIALEGYGTVKVLDVKYLSVHLFAPARAHTDPARSMVRLGLRQFPPYSRTTPPDKPADHNPATAWLHAAAQELDRARWGVHCSDAYSPLELCKLLDKALNMAAKAWWSTHAPEDMRIDWEQGYFQHIHLLQERAPAGLAALFVQAWTERDALALLFNRVRTVNVERLEHAISLATLVQRVQQCLQAMQACLAPGVGWEEGSPWPGTGAPPTHHVVARAGAMLLLQPAAALPEQEPHLASLFDAYARPPRSYPLAPASAPQPQPAPAWARLWHTRWRWFAQHPTACMGRSLCPCCGLPGMDAPADTPPLCASACRLCGWQHDGGDWRAQRLSALYPDLSLALARKRCAFLGYAHLPTAAADQWPHPWRHPRALASQKRLLTAVDALVQQGASPCSSALDLLSALWQDWLRSSAQGTPA